jgi:Bacterial Ig-like domain (group 2)
MYRALSAINSRDGGSGDYYHGLLGATLHLGATLLDSAAVAIPTQVLWDVSDSSIASVDSTGLLTARSPGSAVVTVAAGGMETQGEFVVRQVATEFSVRPASLALAVGGTAALQVEIRDSLGSEM